VFQIKAEDILPQKTVTSQFKGATHYMDSEIS